MAATVWKGHLSFGLVSIPVRLFRAARAERVSLRHLYRPASSVKQAAESSDAQARPAFVPEPAMQPKRTWTEEPAPAPEATPLVPVKRVYQPAEGDEQGQSIRDADLLKGYEYSKGEYVVLDDQDLRSIAPKTSTEMQIVEFIHFNEVDPVYLETSYYLAPDDGGEKAYALLFRGMQETGYAAIGQVTMHRRDHVMILRPGRTGLIAHTMFYTDEVRRVDEFRTDISLASPKELDLARTLIQALATAFDPDKFKNQFRQRLRELIESRAASGQVVANEAPPAAQVIDIMDALRRSLAEVKSGQRLSEAAPVKVERKPITVERSSKKGRVRKAQ